MLSNSGLYANGFFWRTTQQQEIDYVEERARELFAFEFKWNPAKKKVGFSKTFVKGYPNTKTSFITPANYDQFLT